MMADDEQAALAAIAELLEAGVRDRADLLMRLVRGELPPMRGCRRHEDLNEMDRTRPEPPPEPRTADDDPAAILDPAIPLRLIPYLRHTSPAARQAAGDALVQLGALGYEIQTLRCEFREAWALNMWLSAGVLGPIPPDAHELLKAAVRDDPDRHVKDAAFAVSSGFDNPCAELAEGVDLSWLDDELLALTRDRSPRVRLAAHRMYGGDATEPLLAALADPWPQIREVAAERLAALAGDRLSELLDTALADPDQRVRAAVLRSIQDDERPEVLRRAVAHLDDPEPWVRAAAVGVVKRLGEPDPVPLLVPLVADEDATVRNVAGSALGRLGDPRAVPALRQALSDPSSQVRQTAFGALSRLGHRPRARNPREMAESAKWRLWERLSGASLARLRKSPPDGPAE